MWFFRASMRLTFRYTFDRFYRKTGKLLQKDIRCNWIVLCRLLDDLTEHLVENGGQDATFIVLDYIFGTFDRTFQGLYELEEYLERKNPIESDREIAENIKNFKDVIGRAVQATAKLGKELESGMRPNAAVKILKGEVCKPLMTDKSVKEFISEPIFQKTIGKLGYLSGHGWD